MGGENCVIFFIYFLQSAEADFVFVGAVSTAVFFIFVGAVSTAVFFVFVGAVSTAVFYFV